MVYRFYYTGRDLRIYITCYPPIQVYSLPIESSDLYIDSVHTDIRLIGEIHV